MHLRICLIHKIDSFTISNKWNIEKEKKH
jgi:hypothetical protein